MYRSCLGLIVVLMTSNGSPAQLQPPSPIPTTPAAKMRGPIIVGQTNVPPSHRPQDDEQELPDFRLRIFGGNKKNLPDNIDPELLKKLVDKLSKDKDVDKQQIEQMLQDNPQFKDPAFLKQLEKLLQDDNFPQNLEGKFPKNQQPPKLDGEDLGEKFKQVIDSGNKQVDPKFKSDNGDPNVGEDGNTGKKDVPPAKSPYEDNEWVKWLEKNFKDSPAANDAMKDLLSTLDKQDGKGMFDSMPEFKNGTWKDFGDGGKTNTSDLFKGKPNDWNGGKFTSPKIGSGGNGGGGGGGSSGGGSGFGGGTGASFEGGSTVLVVMAAIAAVCLIAFFLFRKWKVAQLANANAIVPGSTRIDFDAIHSRDELVRVYDHVSLEKCGAEARSWNHRVIANQFVEVQPKHVEPANEVAELYERARYAPTDEDLTPREFSDARRDLRTIAGVPS